MIYLYKFIRRDLGKINNDHSHLNKRQRKPKKQSRMDNPKTHATLVTRYRTKTNQKQNTENQKDEQHVPNPGAGEG